MTKLFSVKIGLENKEINGKIQSDGNIYDISGFNFRLNKEKGLYSLSLFSKRNDKIKWIALKIPNPRGLFGPNLYFYDDSFGTNAQTQIRPFMDNNCFSSGQVVVYKNLDNNITFGVGYVEANRFFQTIMQKKSQVELIIDMESKALNDKEVYQFERFILSQPNEDTLHFLDRYAKTIKKVNHIQINDQIPSGFCSWSRYYSDIDEKKINGQIEYTYKYLKDKSPNVIQLDDGWQKHSSFPGIYEVDLEKFPNGLEPLIKKTNQKHMNFGLWFAPTLIKTSAPRFDEIKDLVCFDNKIDCLGSDIYAFDFDNPKFYEFLKKQFSYYAKVLGVKYFKVDFLEHPFSHGYNYQTDYKMALFRKALMAIREACGSDVSLVGCTGFVLPFANIFKVNRITCDVIWNNSSSIEASYQLIRRVSKTISYRYFYNNNLQINDPDGIVVRNYDVGDHYSASFGEAKIVTSMICSSGGSILHNEELNNLEEERLNLVKRLSPALGISARPLDFFELDEPSVVYINRLKAKNPYVYVAVMNYGNNPMEKYIPTKTFGLDKAIIIRSYDNKIMGISDSISDIIDPRSSEIYILIPCPNKPIFLFSDINYTLGLELFDLKNINEKYQISAKRKAYMQYQKYIYVPNGYNFSGELVADLEEGLVYKASN